MQEHGIAIDRAGKTYRSEANRHVVALEPVELNLRPGEFFSLVGPSGCAKTTLLNVIAGLLEPSQGRVRIGDRIFSGPDPSLGIVFQRPTSLDRGRLPGDSGEWK